MVFSDIFGSCNWVSRKIRKLYGAKIKIRLDDRKFSFADIGIISFHNFFVRGPLEFNLAFHKNLNFGWIFFDFGYFGLSYFGFGILEYNHFIRIVVF